MARYIDAEKLCELYTEMKWLSFGDACQAWFAAKIAPTAEVAEVKRGRWLIDRKFGNDVMSGEQMVICSVCGKGIFWGKQNYCPNCGAYMESEDE